MSDIANTYDVIIVGGRVAGASLAARLGQQGLTVLLLERDRLPGLPAASSPAIYGCSMALLDEIGADEAAYARNTPQIRRFVTDVLTDFRTGSDVPDLYGRDYGYAIDRARFDGALWDNAVRFPTVTGLMDVSVLDLTWDHNRVSGVVVRMPDGTTRTFASQLVVGADGRFSLVARKVDAPVSHQRDDMPTTLYYAYWKNARPVDDDGPAVHVHGPGEGYAFLLMDSADDTLAVVIEGRAELLNPPAGQAETFYREILQRHAPVWQRLQNAEQITRVRGMRKVGNFYRQAGGPGWALVGDALHQKDPIDGQGIYDALFTAKALSQAIDTWRRDQRDWVQAAADYEQAVFDETLPMYEATLVRIQTDIYTDIPLWAYKSIVRWVASDEDYRRLTALLVTRGIHPREWLSPWPKLRAIIRGLLRDLRARLNGQPLVTTPVPIYDNP